LSAIGIMSATAHADAPAAPKGVAPIPFPEGVLDAARRTAFVSSPQGGIQAVRLEDGKVLWTNDTAQAQPWLVAGRRLLARGERILVLDLEKDGKLLRSCDAIPYPKVAIPERCTVAFHLWAPRVDGVALTAEWYGVAMIDRRKGRPFPFQAWTAFNKAAPTGAVTINLEDGKVTLRTDPQPIDVTAGLMPAAAQPGQQVPPALPAKLAALWKEYHKDQNGRITALGDKVVGVAMTLEKVGPGYLKHVTLNAWDLKTGTAAAPVLLVKDQAINIANIVLTEDRRHAGVVFGTSALAIYSLTDGQHVGKEVKGVFSPERCVVDGKRLYYAQVAGAVAAQAPVALKALDLDSGKVVWERALKPRSTVPLPP
jgi:hypothetical protein